MTRFGPLVALTCLTVPVNAMAQPSEVYVGALALASRQNVVGPAGLIHSSGTLTGAELMARASGIGLYARYLTGSIGENSFRGPSGSLRMGEARLMIGAPIFSVEGGVALRSRSSTLAEPRDELVRAGARSSIWLGPSGLSLSFAASALGRGDKEGGSTKWGLVGWEAVTAVMYQAPRGLPLYATLGYRYERIRTESGAPPVQREEISAIIIGGGFRYLFWRRPKPPPGS
jgi:hypothetical protein